MTPEQDIELSDEALDQASGGLVVIAIIAVLIGMLVPSVQKPARTTPPGPTPSLSGA